MKNSSICHWIALAALLLFITAVSAQEETFEQWLKKDMAQFRTYNAKVSKEYEIFREQEQKAYAEFVRQAGEKWGKDNIQLPECKVWVQYEEDLEERSSVDFEEGVAHVELLIPEETDAESDAVKQELEEAVQRLVLSGTEGPVEMMRRMMLSPGKGKAARGKQYTVRKGDSLWGVAKKYKVSVSEIARMNGISPKSWLKIGQKLKVPTTAVAVAAASGKKPLLSGQVKMGDGSPVTGGNASDYSKQLVASKKPTVTTIEGDDGTKRKSVAVSFKLVPGHLKVRAERFRPMINKYAKRYGVFPPLVFAVMHTESAFNPRARSHVPAYGLMQLVPRSGGRDAYRYVYKADKLLGSQYLYDPEKNIELGIAYLHIIGDRYLGRIKDPTSRLYCTMAAYNTGAGNVSRAFRNGTSVRLAAPIINAKTSDEVYAQLCTRLPYEETRNYVKRVRDRMPLYME
jgi:membrane-bound lytic murein transglycosylase C